MNFSVIMNVLNEEQNIEYALQSVKKLKNCDEILIADMNSKDRTVEIAKKYGATVIEIPYDEEFDNARSIVINNAKNDWCFLLDADEMISESLGQQIEKIVNEDKCDIVYLPTINYFFGIKSKYGLHYPCHHCRLFKKKYIHVTGKCHNYLNVVNDARELWLQGEENALIHFSYNNIEQWAKKRIRYEKLEPKNKFRSPFLCFLRAFFRLYFKEKNIFGGYDGYLLSITGAMSEQMGNIEKYYKDKNIDIDKLKNQYL